MEKIAGSIALAALLVTFVLPLQVAQGGAAGFAARLDTMKPWLLAVAMVYFVAGTIYYSLWRGRSHDGPQ